MWQLPISGRDAAMRVRQTVRWRLTNGSDVTNPPNQRSNLEIQAPGNSAKMRRVFFALARDDSMHSLRGDVWGQAGEASRNYGLQAHVACAMGCLNMIA